MLCCAVLWCGVVSWVCEVVSCGVVCCAMFWSAMVCNVLCCAMKLSSVLWSHHVRCGVLCCDGVCFGVM